MDLEQLKQQYNNIPLELKQMKRWVCYKVEGTNDGKTTKRPYNALNGAMAKVNDELTWSKFNIALNGCVKYHCDGIGFILGAGIFGIDLDNHADVDGNYPMTDDEFKVLINEFVSTLDSYSEYSQSGKGVHIICRGALPEGARRKGSVEMYDNGRFFAFTGNVINNTLINERSLEVVPLWEKYVNVEKPKFEAKEKSNYRPVNRGYFEELDLSDEEIIDIALNSASGDIFYKYYHDGDISMNNNDNSSADMSFCNMLAFWCNKDKAQMDRIFRHSALYREKWDEMRGKLTYGEITINTACNNVQEGYVKRKYININDLHIKDRVHYNNNEEEKTPIIVPSYDGSEMNIDDEGEPIFHIKKIFGDYPYTDTGNAMRFYEYFGSLFKYNVTDKIMMFWTGKTWIKDSKDIIRKYANKFIEILKIEADALMEEVEKATKEGKKDLSKALFKKYSECLSNIQRVSNKAGKDAMLTEFKALYDIPINSYEFDYDDYLLNTKSGVINLKTSEILGYNKNLLLSKNTNIEVSYEEPTVWLKFLHSVFKNKDEQETENIINSLQTCLGYSLSGSTKEQVMFLLYGNGSNGKSTLTEIIAYILGDYGDNIASSVLLQQKAANNSAIYSIAKLQGKRFVETGETDDGGKLAESQVKILTGGDTISAQFKFGNEFSFRPKFKIWMSTNNKPVIRGTDLGIWRRMFMFPFMNTFTEKEKDKDLLDKLKAEGSKILGWCIKGFQKYQEEGGLLSAETLKKATQEYKEQMDVIAQFINRECEIADGARIDCKELYNAYKDWAMDNVEFCIKESKFMEDLKTKGFLVESASSKKKYYVGISLIGKVTIRRNYE